MYEGVDDVSRTHLQPLLVEIQSIHCCQKVLEADQEKKRTTGGKNGNTVIYSVYKVKYTFMPDDGSFHYRQFVVGEGIGQRR